MDYTSMGIAGAILVYGIVEYFRREQVHRETVAYLKRGLPLPERHQPLLGKIITTGLVAFILTALIVTTFFMHTHNTSERLLIGFLGCSFFAILCVLVLMLRRDIVSYRRQQTN